MVTYMDINQSYESRLRREIAVILPDALANLARHNGAVLRPQIRAVDGESRKGWVLYSDSMRQAILLDDGRFVNLDGRVVTLDNFPARALECIAYRLAEIANCHKAVPVHYQITDTTASLRPRKRYGFWYWVLHDLLGL
jgi:hypothetical protein